MQSVKIGRSKWSCISYTNWELVSLTFNSICTGPLEETSGKKNLQAVCKCEVSVLKKLARSKANDISPQYSQFYYGLWQNNDGSTLHKRSKPPTRNPSCTQPPSSPTRPYPNRWRLRDCDSRNKDINFVPFCNRATWKKRELTPHTFFCAIKYTFNLRLNLNHITKFANHSSSAVSLYFSTPFTCTQRNISNLWWLHCVQKHKIPRRLRVSVECSEEAPRQVQARQSAHKGVQHTKHSHPLKVHQQASNYLQYLSIFYSITGSIFVSNSCQSICKLAPTYQFDQLFHGYVSSPRETSFDCSKKESCQAVSQLTSRY